jgi:periplasmic protein CpxP/Spy
MQRALIDQGDITMNRTIARILPTVVLGSVLLVSTAAFSMGHGDKFDSQRMLAHMTEQLELSESQEQQIGEILASGKEQSQADRKRMSEIRAALEAQRDNFNAGEAQALADELGEITSRMAYQMTSKRAEVYQLLTPEQREQMDEMKKQRDERRSKYRDKN